MKSTGARDNPTWEVQMPKHFRLQTAFVLAAFLIIPRPAFSQFRLESQSFKLGLRSEYFSRMLSGGEGEASPMLASYLVSLALNYKLKGGFSASLLLGYASSNYEHLIFRQLPFSINFEGTGISGFLAGAEASKSLLSSRRIEMDVFGHFLACLGIPKKYEIPGLAVSGSVEANPNWMRAVAGPVFRWRGQEGFSPYLAPCFHYLWGNFDMNQKVSSLSGNEKKEMKSKGQVGLLFGIDLAFGGGLELRAEAGVYPRQNGSDYSVMVQAIFGL